MNLTTYARHLHDLSLLKELGFKEVILEPKGISRFGSLSPEAFRELSQRARELGLRVLLEWDVLMTEDIFIQRAQEVHALLPFTDAVRVQDPGALHWILEKTQFKVQFIAENGNHNLKSLKTWEELSLGRLERIVLSIELSKETIRNYLQNLTTPCELLGLGRILLFYTPRSLLAPLYSEKIALNDSLSAIGESEESPHKGFPILENQNGTFMFHIKEFCLLEFSSELKSMGLGFLRLDQRFGDLNFLRSVNDLIHHHDKEKFDSFKSLYPQDLTKGFFLVNKTDVLFPKLKNSRLQKREGDYLGEVLEVQKGSHLAIMVKHPRGLRKSDLIRFIHPKGEEIDGKIYSLKNLSLKEVDCILPGEVALIQYMGGVWVKSQVFERQESNLENV